MDTMELCPSLRKSLGIKGTKYISKNLTLTKLKVMIRRIWASLKKFLRDMHRRLVSFASREYLDDARCKETCTYLDRVSLCSYINFGKLNDDEVIESIERGTNPGGMYAKIALILIPVVVAYFFGIPKTLLSTTLPVLFHLYRICLIERRIAQWQIIKDHVENTVIELGGCNRLTRATLISTKQIGNFLKRKYTQLSSKLRG